MPSEVMEQRGLPASSHFFEEIRFSSEKQIRKLQSMPDHHRVGMDGTMIIPGSKLDSLSSLEKFLPVVGRSVHRLETPQSNLARIQAERQSIGGEGIAHGSRASWKPMDHDLKLWSDLCTKPASYSLDGEKNLTNGIQHESSLFSSSLSEIFCRKLRLSANDDIYHQPTKTVLSNYEKEPLNCFEGNEGQTIGNLLPDEDDLFSGMTDALAHGVQPNSGDELEDFDLFSNGGGLELGEDHLSAVHQKYNLVGGVLNSHVSCNGPIAGEHPSRTLFVRNICSSIEDSELKALFEQYGDIRTLYTACKHRGFVMISYYDIRAARNAMRALQNKPLKYRNLDIHYSIPKDNASEKDVNQGILVVSNLDSNISNDELLQIFGVYGEVKQIQETPDRNNSRFIEFYDVRAAEMALCAINKTNNAGKQIKLEPGYPGGAKRGLVQVSSLRQDDPELKLCNSFF